MTRTFSLLLFVVAASCGGTTVGGASSDAGVGGDSSGGGGHDGGSSGVDGGGGTDAAGGTDGSGGGNDGGGGACAIPPAGSTFTFHLHNGGATDMGLSYGCGGTIPVMVATPGGTLGIGPGPANGCEFTCESEYKGPVQTACSDCGPGVGAPIAAGGTVDIAWDRRVYVPHVADPQCVGGQTGVNCALAQAVAPTSAQQGTLTVCTASTNNGFCSSSSSGGGTTKDIPFTVDTTASEATIQVQ
jgi:hypothetical protein